MSRILLALLLPLTAFAETVISPNMNLPVPIVGTTSGPDWANDINSCMGAIDSHDHTPGKGVPISSAAININANLPLNNNALTQVKDVAFTSQSSISTTQALYVEAPDLFYNDGNGNIIQITQSGSVAGASGTITGLPSGTASASYQSVGGTFQFQSATNTPANGTFASLTIAPQTSSPSGITLKSPNPLSASYNVTFPAAVPAFTSLLAMSTSGVLSTVPYLAPTQQRFITPAGIQTYTLPTNPTPLYIRVRMVGGGGGGGACTTNGGGTGGSSTFGSNTAVGGTGGAVGAGVPAAAGGGASIGTGVGTTLTGGSGGTGLVATTPASGSGGNSAFGGGGGSIAGAGTQGTNGVTNTGGGGSGGACSTTSSSGGGAGGFVDAIISSPSATYSYAVGSAGAGGTGGAAGGGLGGAGYVEVTEYYQ